MLTSNVRILSAFRKWIAGRVRRPVAISRVRLHVEQVEDRVVPATVVGLAWYDTNANGTLDVDENLASGVSVTLTEAPGGASMTVTTDENGYYGFVGPMRGTFTVEFTPPDGFVVGDLAGGATSVTVETADVGVGAPLVLAGSGSDSGSGSGSDGSGSVSSSVREIVDVPDGTSPPPPPQPPQSTMSDLSIGTAIIPVNANNDNGSAIKEGLPGIPTVRDFSATDLPKDDAQLIETSLTFGGGRPGTLTYTQYEPGEAETKFWKDKRKAAPLGVIQVPATANGANWTYTFYTEGVHESSSTQDFSFVTFTFTPADASVPPIVKTFELLVGPILMDPATDIPTPSVAFTNQAPLNGLAGLTGGKPPAAAGGVPTPGITFTATVKNAGLTLKYLQNGLSLQNGANGSAAGAVYVAGSGIANKNNVIKANSGFSFPGVDTELAGTPLYPTTTSPQQDAVVLTASDMPGSGSPSTPAVDGALDKLDLKISFRMYIVVVYDDGIYYSIASCDWNVNFFATTNRDGDGPTVIAPASRVSIDSSLRHTNDDPGKTSGPTMNNSFEWRNVP